MNKFTISWALSFGEGSYIFRRRSIPQVLDLFFRAFIKHLIDLKQSYTESKHVALLQKWMTAQSPKLLALWRLSDLA
jgi:hypothetical protein